MNYQTVFTATDVDFDIFVIFPIFFFFAALILMFVFFKMKEENEKKKRYARIFSVAFAGIAFYFMISQTPDNIRTLHKFEYIFKKGDYMTVEGEIEDFREYPDSVENGYISGYWNNTFRVKDVNFAIHSNSDFRNKSIRHRQGKFYDYTAKFKGPINKNGQNVRISYIRENGKNKIIKIEISPEDDSFEHEEMYLNIGGVEQYIEIWKSSENNPVLLFIHGGAAWPQTPQFRYFNTDIAEKFTVVLWEQRGAGKSYIKNPKPGNISLKQIVKDGHEVVSAMKEKFKTDKVFLAGYSWGSIVALEMIKETPQDFHAYIGIAQVINPRIGLEYSRNKIKETATEKNDTDALAVIDSIEQGLIKDTTDIFMKQYGIVYSYGYAVHKKNAEDSIEKAMRHYDDYKDYDWEAAYFYSADFLNKDIFATNFLDLKKIVIPVYLIEGRYDWNVPSVLAELWLNNLKAPEKQLFWMENAAHGTLEEDPADFNNIMLNKIPIK